MTMRDGVLKVVSSAPVVMKGTKRNNLYYYQGNILIGSATIVSKEENVVKTTMLWHASEKLCKL